MAKNLTKELEKMTRVAGGVGASRAKESDFQELVRLMGVTILGDTLYYKDKNPIEQILELSKTVAKNAIDFASLLNFVRLEVGVRHSVAFALIGALEGGHREFLKYLDKRFFLRPTDIVDILEIYIKRGNRKTLPKALKKVMSDALNRFDEYQYSKYARVTKANANNFKVVDAFNLIHPVPAPKNEELFRKVVKNELEPAFTWEVLLSTNTQRSKKEVWKELLDSNRLPSLAALRNIRNMLDAGVKEKRVAKYIKKNVSLDRIFADQIMRAWIKADSPKVKKALMKKLAFGKGELLKGKTLLVLDISGSMGGTFDINSIAISSFAFRALSNVIAIANSCEEYDIVLTAGDDYKLKHASAFIKKPKDIEELGYLCDMYRENEKLSYGGIFTYQVLDWVKEQKGENSYTRVIVVSDSQDMDRSKKDKALPYVSDKIYINNIAPYSKVAYKEGSIENTEFKYKEFPVFSSKVAKFVQFTETYSFIEKNNQSLN